LYSDDPFFAGDSFRSEQLLLDNNRSATFEETGADFADFDFGDVPPTASTGDEDLTGNTASNFGEEVDTTTIETLPSPQRQVQVPEASFLNMISATGVKFGPHGRSWPLGEKLAPRGEVGP
jgi:hypothetical protein